MALLLLALGLVLIVEGLVYALAPSLVEDMLKALAQVSIDIRRSIGLIALCGGIALVWAAKSMGAF
ncbi:MAG: DUF2065 domain-containing protein [Rhodobacteraceae bacterium]|nr:DUF2065 domain-containing protein [Paracoccaceae bacterium]